SARAVPPGGPLPNAPLKADRQELPCRCARTVVFDSDIQVSWLADPHLRPPSRALTPWRYLGSGSSLTVARQLRHHTGFPWCPWRSYARSAVSRTQLRCFVAGIAKSKRSVASARSRSLLGKPGQSPRANFR